MAKIIAQQHKSHTATARHDPSTAIARSAAGSATAVGNDTRQHMAEESARDKGANPPQ